MKILIAILLMVSAYSQTTQLTDDQFTTYVEMTEKGMKVDLLGLCSDALDCTDGIDVSYSDMLTLSFKFKSSKYGSMKITKAGLTYCNHYNTCGNNSYVMIGRNINIKSNLAIVELTSPQNHSIQGARTIYLESLKSFNNSVDQSIAVPMQRAINVITRDVEIVINSITLSSSMTNLKPFFDNAKLPLKNALKMTKKETLTFQKHMSKSDRNLDHFERFIVSLEDAQSILEDKKNYSVLDWRIQEGMRRVVSFGMIISDLLWAYEDVPGASKNIENIRKFRDEVRSIYGWQDTLAGNVSKTTSALLELAHYEINEIIKVKLALGTDDSFKVYKEITNEVRRLITKINGSDGGDIVVGQHIHTLMNLWNDSQWQIELKNLMEAKLDVRKLVRPKLKYILNAMLALEELIDNRRIYFEIDVIKAASEDKPTKG